MNLAQFNEADEMEQLEAVWDSKYIGTKEEENYLITLYAINNFFVEEYFDKVKDVRAKFVALDNVEVLYLKGLE